MLKLAKCSKFCRVTKMRSFHANSIMKEIQLLLAQRITLAAFGEIPNPSKSLS